MTYRNPREKIETSKVGGDHLTLKQIDSILAQIQISGIDNAFIIENSALERLLFNRNLVGLDFTKACEESSIAFLQHFASEIRPLIGNLAEYMLLSKGLYYWMHNAFSKVFVENLQVNFAATSRVEVTETNTSIEIPYFNFDCPANNLIIADTIASGATICAALAKYLEHHSIHNIFIFSIAGSVVGGQNIAAFCRLNKISLTVVYGLAAFGLAENGFDLSFLHPETITSVKYINKAREVFHNKPVSAVGWDFGSQAQAIYKYKMLCWLEAEKWGLQDTDVFMMKEPPTDLDLIKKEYSAFSHGSN